MMSHTSLPKGLIDRYAVWGAAIAFLLGISEIITSPLSQSLGLPRDTPIGLNWFFAVPAVIAVAAFKSGKTRGFPFGIISIIAPIAAYLIGYTLECALRGYSVLAYAVIPLGLFIIPAYVIIGLLSVYAGIRFGRMG